MLVGVLGIVCQFGARVAAVSVLVCCALAVQHRPSIGQEEWQSSWTLDQKLAVQEALIWARTYYGLVDGQVGRMTRTAISDWQGMKGYPATGYLTPPQYDRLTTEAGATRQQLRFGIFLEPTTTFRVGFPFALMSDRGHMEDQSLVEYSSLDGTASYAMARFPCGAEECWNGLFAAMRSDVNDVVYEFIGSGQISVNGITGDQYIVYFVRRENGTAGLVRLRFPKSDSTWLAIATAVGTYFDPFNNRSIRLAPLQPASSSPAPTPPQPAWGANAPPQGLPVPPPPPRYGEPVVTSSGSGFFVNGSGDVVTNHHVIAGCDDVRVITHDRQAEDARVRAVDARSDLAVLATPLRPEQFVRLRTGSSIPLGADVIALGFPLGQLLGSQVSATRGNVSSLVGIADDTTELTITAPIQPGNSGGPLLDANGLLTGVVVATLDSGRMLEMTGAIPQNVNFAIKSLVLQAFLDGNGVEYETGSPEDADRVPAEMVAQQAAAYTVRVECHE